MNFERLLGAAVMLAGAFLLTSCATEPFAKVPFNVSLSAPNTISIDAEPSDLAMGDFNGDGMLDLISMHFVRNGIAFHEGDGQGGFAPSRFIDLGPRPVVYKVLDFNEDGIDDFLVLLDASREVVLLTGSDSGVQESWRFIAEHSDDEHHHASTFSLEVGRFGIEHGGFGDENALFFMDAGYINNDAELDLVLTYEGGDFEVWLGEGGGHFHLDHEYETDIQLPRLILLDADNDGLDDVFLFGNSISIQDESELDGNQTEFFHNDNGEFHNSETIFRNFIGLAYQITLTDFDQDGVQDIVLNYLNGTMVTVLPNLGTGTFEPGVNYLTKSPEDVAFADLDGDGDVEMITSLNRGQFQVGKVNVFLNAGNMRLRAPETFDVEIGPRALVSGDLNGDGLADIAVINVFSGELSVLLNETEL